MLAAEWTVAKGRGGRPRKSEGEKGTRHVRVFEDLADMIGWIYYFESQEQKTSVAQILDPILRSAITDRYAPYAEAVKKVKAAQAQAPRPPDPDKKKPKSG